MKARVYVPYTRIGATGDSWLGRPPRSTTPMRQSPSAQGEGHHGH